MKTEQISYSELARRVGDCVLFNNHNAHNEQWYETIYMQPLLEKALDDENNELMEGLTDEEKDEVIAAKSAWSRSRASAIRAAGAEKTAESGNSPSTHNSASE